MSIRPLNELLAEAENSLYTINENGWGPWKLNRSIRGIYVEFPYVYELHVAQISPEALMGTLKHMFEKPWVNNEYLGGLARAAFAITEAVRDPIHSIDLQRR